MTGWQKKISVPPTCLRFISSSGSCLASPQQGRGGGHGGRRTERRRMLTHLRPSGVVVWVQRGGKQTQEPTECEQLFQARSRHGNSSSLQSWAYLRAIRAGEKTRQQLLLFTISFWIRGGACLGWMWHFPFIHFPQKKRKKCFEEAFF